MRTKLLFASLALSSLVLSSAALLAQDKLTWPNAKEGLWETTVSHSMTGMPGMSEDTLAKLPPEQRARMEEMMKQRGMSMSGNTTVVKSCVTKEKIEKGMAFAENRDNCTHSVTKSSPLHQEIKLHCEETKNGNKTIMDGTIVIDIPAADTVKGTTHIAANSNGRTMNIDSTFSSRYLGAACGDIK
jgi:Protein of unknown function (DUF3617)